MDQGVIPAFKARFLRYTFSNLIDAVDSQQVSIKQFWKSYNIMHAIYNIQRSWDEVSQQCLKAAWKKVRLNLEEESELANDMQNELVEMAHQLHFNEVDADDIQALLQEDKDNPLTNEELQELTVENLVREDANSDIDVEEPPVKDLATKILSNCLSQVSNSLDILFENDPDFARSCTVKRNVLNALTCYSEILREKKRQATQSTLDKFLSKN